MVVVAVQERISNNNNDRVHRIVGCRILKEVLLILLVCVTIVVVMVVSQSRVVVLCALLFLSVRVLLFEWWFLKSLDSLLFVGLLWLVNKFVPGCGEKKKKCRVAANQ